MSLEAVAAVVVVVLLLLLVLVEAGDKNTPIVSRRKV